MNIQKLMIEQSLGIYYTCFIIKITTKIRKKTFHWFYHLVLRRDFLFQFWFLITNVYFILKIWDSCLCSHNTLFSILLLHRFIITPFPFFLIFFLTFSVLTSNLFNLPNHPAPVYFDQSYSKSVNLRLFYHLLPFFPLLVFLSFCPIIYNSVSYLSYFLIHVFLLIFR